MAQAEIGVIGGSGLYRMEELKNIEEVSVNTPFGDPSDSFVVGKLFGRRVAFLPRHGRHHTMSPTKINYRANIYAFKKLGVRWIIASSACGSFKEELSPGTIVVLDQLFDRTRARNANVTFFEDDIVAHVSLADPFCPTLSEIVYKAGKESGAKIVNGGTYINMEGPAFSTRAESLIYKGWGVDVIGMTNLFEARLCREAEIHFSTMALVTDYDCWHDTHAAVDVEMVIKTMQSNAETFRRIVMKAVEAIPAADVEDACSSALKFAIITPPEHIATAAKSRLSAIIGKYIS